MVSFVERGKGVDAKLDWVDKVVLLGRYAGRDTADDGDGGEEDPARTELFSKTVQLGRERVEAARKMTMRMQLIRNGLVYSAQDADAARVADFRGTSDTHYREIGRDGGGGSGGSGRRGESGSSLAGAGARRDERPQAAEEVEGADTDNEAEVRAEADADAGPSTPQSQSFSNSAPASQPASADQSQSEDQDQSQSTSGSGSGSGSP